MTRPLRFVLLRHAETELNRRGRYQGQRCDAPLTPAGSAQACEVAHSLVPESWSGLWCSTAGRARRTAAPIATALDRPAHALPDFVERDLGLLDGTDIAAHRSADPGAAARLAADECWAPAGGETLPEVRHRMFRGLRTVAAQVVEPSGALLIVTHGAAINAVVRGLDRATDLPLIGHCRSVVLIWWPADPPSAARVLAQGLGPDHSLSHIHEEIEVP